MIGAEEKRRLMERVGRDSIGPLGAVLKCAAGLAILVLIATGPWAFFNASGPTVTATAGEHAAPQAGTVRPRTLAESKRVFDERREHHEAGRQYGAPRLQDGMAAAAGQRSE
jgi:hypothetical protein